MAAFDRQLEERRRAPEDVSDQLHRRDIVAVNGAGLYLPDRRIGKAGDWIGRSVGLFPCRVGIAEFVGWQARDPIDLNGGDLRSPFIRHGFAVAPATSNWKASHIAQSPAQQAHLWQRL